MPRVFDIHDLSLDHFYRRAYASLEHAFEIGAKDISKLEGTSTKMQPYREILTTPSIIVSS